MAKERVIILQTQNAEKVREYQDIFAEYGIKVIQDTVHGWIEEVYDAETLTSIEHILNSPAENQRVLAVMRERSDLYERGTTSIVERKHLQLADHTTELHVFCLESEGIRKQVFKASNPGYIDLRKRKDVAKNDTFDWDDIFVGLPTGMTYQEMREKDLKCSSRDMVLAQYIQENLYYKQRLDRNFDVSAQGESIDFKNSPIDRIRKNPLFHNEFIQRFGLDRCIESAMKNGLFFRSAKNRREKNYWAPGLNAGIPFVAKEDKIHEDTFLAHDLFHFLFPDLIFDGEVNDTIRKVYIIHRMMSEALTIVMADMLFIDTLKKSGVDYDFSARGIHPLFESMQFTNMTDEQVLKVVLRANTHFALRGDDSLFRYHSPNPEALEEYTQRYKTFFIGDLSWTDKNFDSMAKRAGVLSRFKQDVAPALDLVDTQGRPEFLSEYVRRLELQHGDLGDLSVEELTEIVFEDIYTNILAKALAKPVAQTTASESLEAGFIRYMAGQSYIFSLYDFVPESKIFREAIFGYLKEKKGNIKIEDIDHIRAYFNQYIDLLYDKNLISEDDRDTYKEVVPVFPPCYIDYNWKNPGDLTALSREILTEKKL